jgi:hypothetical protein
LIRRRRNILFPFNAPRGVQYVTARGVAVNGRPPAGVFVGMGVRALNH